MPAYRSEAEAEIRQEVVAQLRGMIPGCRIIHEINAESFGNRIDVLAVGVDRIAAVEIKSKKDKLDRLPAQAKAMRSVAHESYAAYHEKFLITKFGVMYPPDCVRLAPLTSWVYPKADRRGYTDIGATWRRAKNKSKCLPSGAIMMLWRDELHEACRSLGVKGVAKLDRLAAADELRYRLTGEQLTKLVCSTLRARICPEADPPMKE